MSLLRIVHAQGAIPNEIGPTRCRATTALNQSADETRTPGSRRRIGAALGDGWSRVSHQAESGTHTFVQAICETRTKKQHSMSALISVSSLNHHLHKESPFRVEVLHLFPWHRRCSQGLRCLVDISPSSVSNSHTLTCNRPQAFSPQCRS